MRPDQDWLAENSERVAALVPLHPGVPAAAVLPVVAAHVHLVCVTRGNPLNCADGLPNDAYNTRKSSNSGGHVVALAASHNGGASNDTKARNTSLRALTLRRAHKGECPGSIEHDLQ